MNVSPWRKPGAFALRAAAMLALRAVTSVDGMTTDYYPFSHEFLGKTATRITGQRHR